MTISLRIAFICGCLESSKDGVADYTLILAKQLARPGHKPICISLNDSFICSSLNISPNVSVSDGILLVRFSSNCPWLQKYNHIKKILNDNEISILSLQYVPYAFSKKGIPFRLLVWLPLLGTSLKWHIMFHELWVDKSLKKSYYLLALLQKIILKFLVNVLRPIEINTTNHYYQNLLLHEGIISNLLPLNSNISMVKVVPASVTKPNRWVFIFFGSIHQEWKSELFFDRLDAICTKNLIIECNFILIGRSGVYGQNLWSSLTQKHKKLNFQIYGECSQEEISRQLQLADFGVTTTPSHLIEKSGSVAAMLSHGLPVIITRVTQNNTEWNHKLKVLPEFVLFDHDFEERLSSASKYTPHPISNSSATNLIQALQ